MQPLEARLAFTPLSVFSARRVLGKQALPTAPCGLTPGGGELTSPLETHGCPQSPGKPGHPWRPRCHLGSDGPFAVGRDGWAAFSRAGQSPQRAGWPDLWGTLSHTPCEHRRGPEEAPGANLGLWKNSEQTRTCLCASLCAQQECQAGKQSTSGWWGAQEVGTAGRYVQKDQGCAQKAGPGEAWSWPGA